MATLKDGEIYSGLEGHQTVVYARHGHWEQVTLEQPARDRAEHGATSKAVRLNSVLVRISMLSSCLSLFLYVSGFQIVVCKRVTFIWYASSFQWNI